MGPLLFDSGGFPQPVCKVNLIRRLSGNALVGPVLIKANGTSFKPRSEFSDPVVGVEVNMLVVDRAPQPFDKHVVHSSAFTIHADLSAVALQDAGEGIACELTALKTPRFSSLVARADFVRRLFATC